MSGEKRRVREILTYGRPFGPKQRFDRPRRATYLKCLPRGNWGFCELDGRQNEQSLKTRPARPEFLVRWGRSASRLSRRRIGPQTLLGQWPQVPLRTYLYANRLGKLEGRVGIIVSGGGGERRSHCAHGAAVAGLGQLLEHGGRGVLLGSCPDPFEPLG